MSFNKFMATYFACAVLHAQMPQAGGELGLTGEVQAPGSTRLNSLYVELFDPRSHMVVERTAVSSDGSFRFYHGVGESTYTVRVVTGAGEDPLLEESRQISQGNALVLRLPEQKSSDQPASGTVSVQELQNPIPKQAIRAAVEAGKYSEAHETAKAIAKLERAIKIAPNFRDAHANLGVQYAHAGRMPEALAQFRFALDIGPPSALIYSNLALGLLTLKEYQQGGEFARKAVALEPGNVTAQRLLRYAEAHSRSLAAAAQ